MGYKICKFQNVSPYGDEVPDIVIDDTHPDWDEIFQTWIDGKNPTDSPLWKKGVIACTKLKEET